MQNNNIKYKNIVKYLKKGWGQSKISCIIAFLSLTAKIRCAIYLHYLYECCHTFISLSFLTFIQVNSFSGLFSSLSYILALVAKLRKLN